jgi:hypothetical protein
MLSRTRTLTGTHRLVAGSVWLVLASMPLPVSLLLPVLALAATLANREVVPAI